MTLTYKNRKIYVEVDFSGAACDSFYAHGNYEDGAMEDLTDQELDDINENYQQELAEYCLERAGYWRE